MRHWNVWRKLLAFPLVSALVFTASAKAQQSQTIHIVPIQDQVYGVAPFQVIALASSGLPVTLSASGPATLNGRLLTITGAGTVTITAQQQGNLDYAPASAQISFMVKQGSPAIQWNPGTIVYGTPLDSTILNASATAVPGFDLAADAATVTSQFDQSQISDQNNITYPQTSSVFRFEGPPLVQNTNPLSNGAVVPDPSIQVLQSYRVAFTCDCQQFEFVIQPYDRYRLWVDGVWTTTDWIWVPASLKFPHKLYYKVQFRDKRQRQIKLNFTRATPFFGIITSGTDTISAPQTPINPQKLVLFGDSWTAPALVEAALTQYEQDQPSGVYGSGYGQILGEYLNLNWWESGLGGSGFISTGPYSPQKNFVQREQTDLCYPDPDIVVIMGGVNDPQNEPAEQQAAAQFLSQLQNCIPNAQLFFIGPQAASASASAAFSAAAAQFPSVHYLNPTAENWLYGSPTDASTGNAYLYLNGHPTPLAARGVSSDFQHGSELCEGIAFASRIP
ncbi:MAG TPA: SGNH/GDSL hydrolase family protein [Alloacidobacterium sp.]|jgi:lysophospholipase L1-like esterase|nr:SGNH/GDSL hydrolase family protein [Alloacidobacterium sp.]